ncbi:amidohydrolase [Microvirga sp. KLBC 81]|uniref:amidohydrolase family protein n=1 Tax=Microvirga sp. KLBC 81 TaxID=1862707 RepID=UPI000D51D9D3|nr:amidohydrolase family protein [Microvirga sp. KLBC 81]PVE25146.1 amidohydrolase [Microvirga sp. KLBC 81]
MRIDSHQHFWRVSRGDYFWMSPDVEVLYRDYGPEDLQPLLARHDIDRTILVQAAPSVAETEFMLEIAEAAPFVAGVVGWVGFTDPDSAQTIERLATNPLIVGFRPMVQDIPDDDWLLRPDLTVAFLTLVEQRLVFDALVLPRHLSRALVVADRYPDLSIVIDHGAKPLIREGLLDPWRADMAAMAARPNTVCKLSGLVTEARAEWTIDDLRPYVDHLLKVFGPERLLWGSDWPVVNLAGGYDRWRDATQELIAGLSDAEKAAILGGNAARIYLGGRGRR